MPSKKIGSLGNAPSRVLKAAMLAQRVIRLLDYNNMHRYQHGLAVVHAISAVFCFKVRYVYTRGYVHWGRHWHIC